MRHFVSTTSAGTHAAGLSSTTRSSAGLSSAGLSPPDGAAVGASAVDAASTRTDASAGIASSGIPFAGAGLGNAPRTAPQHAQGHTPRHRSRPVRRSRDRVLIVGTNSPARTLARALINDASGALELAGFVDDRLEPRADEPSEALEAPLLGTTQRLGECVRARHIDRVYLALPLSTHPRIRQLLDQLNDTTASVFFVPDMRLAEPLRMQAASVCGLPVIAVCDTPFRGARGVFKRAFDLTIALPALVAAAPAMGLIALAIRITTPGPVLFRQRRYGLDGAPIEVWKFRTMRVQENGAVVRQATRDDDRVTPLGAFLRRTSLDELPQLFNVLGGSMSVVGPRPHAVAHNEMYRRIIRGYMVRHKVRPGITGWAQVNGSRGETDTVDKMRQRLAYDLEYVARWSPALDLRIVWRTARLLVRGDDNAY